MASSTNSSADDYTHNDVTTVCTNEQNEVLKNARVANIDGKMISSSKGSNQSKKSKRKGGSRRLRSPPPPQMTPISDDSASSQSNSVN